MLDLLSTEIEHYIQEHTSPEPDHLARLNRQTHLQTTHPQMLSGHLQGRFLAMISQLIRPKLVVEIGTFTGYSAICMAEGLSSDGKVITLEIDPERAFIIDPAIAEAGMQDKIEVRYGDALELIPDLSSEIDLAFIDADKDRYDQYFELLLPKMRKGGLILGDNVLWSGKVVDPQDQSKDTEGIRRFNQLVANDERVECLLLPLRDGVMMARKR